MRRYILKNYLSLILLIFLVGCAYNPIPKGYKGPTAMITDTYEKKEESSAQYYVLNSIDKKFITKKLWKRHCVYSCDGFPRCFA